MGKRGKFVIFCMYFLFAVFIFSLVSSGDCTSFTYSDWSSCVSGIQTRTILTSSPENCSGGNPILNQSCVSEANLSKVDKAFQCLSNELKSDCSGATTVQQLAFSILASPENITGACVNQLLKKNKTEGCFGDNNNCGIKETAWAILALDHVGKNVTQFIDWLYKQNKTSSDVEWFLQQDSVGDVNCKITYDGEDYLFSAKENKKLSGNLGPCFNFAQTNYWLRLNENCFDTEFVLSCDKEFFAGWHYTTFGSPTLNILSETSRTAANQEVRLEVDSRCFGSGAGCNFEDTAWAVYALKRQDYDIKPFVPYLISGEDSNYMYFPAALNYLILEYSSLYGNKIIQQQKSGTYWEADNSVYGQMYDTALALLVFGPKNTQEQLVSARNWVWNFKQEANGCWNSRNIRDTAFLLWALEQRQAETDSEIIISPVTKCEDAGYFCSGSFDCNDIGGEKLGNYFCGGNTICCSKDVSQLKTCSDLLGTICKGDLICSGSTKKASDGTCCLGDCVEKSPSTTECEDYGYSCRSSCLSSQEEVSYSCDDSSKVCCAKSSSPGSDDGGVPIWVWLLIGILILSIVLAIVFKDRIKVLIYKYKNRKKGPQGGPGMQRPPFGGPGAPRPGFPPLVRPMGRPMTPPLGRPMQRPPIQNGPQDAFARLKEMRK